MDWHEIANDVIYETKYALIYCPLTGTATAWNRKIDDRETTFGVSGRLYNNNIIPYDRETSTLWSQLADRGIRGNRIRRRPEVFAIMETTWATWQSLFPQSEAVTSATGYGRDYGRYPYGSYRQSKSVIFPLDRTDDRLHPKKRCYALTQDGKAVVYTLEKFSGEVRAYREQTQNGEVIVAGSEAADFIVGFLSKTTDNEQIKLELIKHKLPDLFRSEDGTLWDVFGYATEGPQAGKRLIPARGGMGYWMSWAAFHEEVILR